MMVNASFSVNWSRHLWYNHKTRSWSNKAVSNQTTYMGKQIGHKNVESTAFPNHGLSHAFGETTPSKRHVETIN